MYNILGLWKVDLMASLTVIFIESLLLLVSERGNHVLFGSRIAIIFKTPATVELFVSTSSLVISALKVIC